MPHHIVRSLHIRAISNVSAKCRSVAQMWRKGAPYPNILIHSQRLVSSSAHSSATAFSLRGSEGSHV